MARLESPALTLVEYGDEKLWRSAWRSSHYQVRHIIRGIEFRNKESIPIPEKIRLAKVLLRAINQRECGTPHLREYLRRRQNGLRVLQERFQETPDAQVGDVPLFKVCD